LHFFSINSSRRQKKIAEFPFVYLLDTNHHRSWWLEMFLGKSKEALAKEYLKSRSCKVRDVMTKNVITAKPTAPVRDIAALLEKTTSSEYRLSKKVK
jgi:CBS domain-containing protein